MSWGRDLDRRVGGDLRRKGRSGWGGVSADGAGPAQAGAHFPGGRANGACPMLAPPPGSGLHPSAHPPTHLRACGRWA